MTGIPNCVPEYFRSLQDDYDHEWAMAMERNEYYKQNREYRERRMREGCAELDFYPSDCESCPHGEEAPARGEDDDFPTMICSNWESCPVFRRETESRFPNTTWEEIVSWFK